MDITQHTFIWKLLHWPLEIWYMGANPGVGACSGYYSTCTCTYSNKHGICWILISWSWSRPHNYPTISHHTFQLYIASIKLALPPRSLSPFLIFSFRRISHVKYQRNLAWYGIPPSHMLRCTLYNWSVTKTILVSQFKVNLAGVQKLLLLRRFHKLWPKHSTKKDKLKCLYDSK